MIYIILLLGAILRIISLNQSFWLDEATSALVVKDLNIVEILTKFSPADFHPPLYYLLLKIWTIPFGISEISTRLLSVSIGLVTIWIVYLLGKRILNQNLGVTAAILMAVAPLHIYYSQEARMYALETFLVCLSAYFFLGTFKQASLKNWLGFSISLLALGFSDYLPLLMIPLFWAYAIFSKKTRKWWGGFLIAQVPLVAGFAFWSPVLMTQLAAGFGVQSSSPAWWQVLGRSSLKELLLIPVKFMVGRISFENKIIYAGIVLLVGILNLFLMVKAIKYFTKTVFLWLWLLIPIVLAFFLGFKVSVFSYFRLIFVLPAFYLLLALGLLALKKKVFPLLFVLLIITNMAFSLTYLLNLRFHRENWRDLVSYIKEQSQSKKSLVVFPTNSQQEAYVYYVGKRASYYGEVNGKEEQIWLMRYVQDIADPKDNAKLKIENLGFEKTEEKNFNGVLVWRYQKTK